MAQTTTKKRAQSRTKPAGRAPAKPVKPRPAAQAGDASRPANARSTRGYRTHHIAIEDLAALVGGAVDIDGKAHIPVLSRQPLGRGRPASWRLYCVASADEDQGGARARALASDAFAAGPRARAVLNGREIAEQDLRQAGGAFTLEEVRKLLNNVSRQRIEQLVRSGDLLAVPGPSNRRRYPAVQFNPDGSLVPCLRLVQSALGTRNPWVVLNFLIHPDDRLQGRAPIDVLREGHSARVVEAAARAYEPGA